MSDVANHAVGQSEADLRTRFDLREELFQQDNLKLNLLLPKSAEDLLDEEAFAQDERMPYWADLWPSARALARWLVIQPPPVGRWLELGCGVGLPTLTVRWRGGDIVATDHNPDALQFVRANAQRSGISEVHTQLLDWRDSAPVIGNFDVVIAADVLYEQRNAIALVDLLPRITAPTGAFILADPGRRWAGEFRRRMRAAGWRETELDLIKEPQVGKGAASLVQINRWENQRPLA